MTKEQREAVAAMLAACSIAKNYTEHQVEQPRGPEERNLHAAAEVALRLARDAGLSE